MRKQTDPKDLLSSKMEKKKKMIFAKRFILNAGKSFYFRKFDDNEIPKVRTIFYCVDNIRIIYTERKNGQGKNFSFM